MTDEEFNRLNEELIRLLRRGRPRKRISEVARLRDRCRDCDRYDPEFYMVSNELWRAAFPPRVTPAGRLCLNCLEKRLGRRLAREEIGNGSGGVFNGRLRLSPRQRPFGGR